MKTLATVLIVLGLMLPSYGLGQGEAGLHRGIMDMSCGKWIDLRKKMEKLGTDPDAKKFEFIVVSGLQGFR